MRVLIGRAVTQLITSRRLRAVKRGLAALPRRLLGRTAQLEYCHQLDDPYSHLLLQLLPALLRQYRLQLSVHLVPPPTAAAAPELLRLQDWSRRDAAQLAQQLGLEFNAEASQPSVAQLALANQAALAVLARGDALEQLLQIGGALWSGDGAALQSRASSVSPAELKVALNVAAARRRKLGHYLGATLFFEGESYWSVDRLHYLEQRLRDAGLARAPLTWLAALPQVECRATPTNTAQPQLYFYCSFRSPYTYLAVARVRQLAAQYGARLHLKFVLPMAMRGLPVPLEKRLYIVRDTKREAEQLGLRFGDIADPLGAPTERGLAVLHQAIAAGKGGEFAESFLQGVFADGIDAGSDAGLQLLARRAGLDAGVVSTALADQSWREQAEANREELFGLGLWGVPAFRMDNAASQWGQDRLWLIERDLIAATAARV
jgi:2-hydroxychromene-2-carboxylate isomerase